MNGGAGRDDARPPAKGGGTIPSSMPHSHDDILKFYDDFGRHRGWERLEALRTFLPTLFRERSLEGCTLFTSHEILCIVRYPTYAERQDKPVLQINSTDAHRLQFDLRVTLASGAIYRAVTESANCPLESGLQEFDRLYAKFLDAHKDLPPRGDDG